MLAWPLEWMILLSLSASGVCFWSAAARYRNRIEETERAKLILKDYV